MKELTDIAVRAAIEAGEAIMKVYSTADFGVEMKSDNSPLTIADRNAHAVIINYLNATSIPALSEEDVEPIPYSIRKSWARCWIVDPLDGTKEFIKRNGEFTVNIALIENGIPLFGVIYTPAQDVLHYSVPGVGAFRCDNAIQSLSADLIGKNAMKLPLVTPPSAFTIVGSRSHSSPETEKYVAEMQSTFGAVDFMASGSSLKFCLVAEGKAHSYPRFAPTMEWDTAAGHAILVASGGNVVVWPDQSPLLYNREELLNPWFLATR